MPMTFTDLDRKSFDDLLRWRRDVRHFLPAPVDAGLLQALLAKAHQAPSVGLSQPWRFVLVETPGLREQVLQNFEASRVEAEAGVPLHRRGQYSRAKLEGLREAPVHLAVFTDTGTFRGHGLGRYTMPETLEHSTVMAVHTLWLAARLEGLGVGWVSILDPEAIKKLLNVPVAWKCTAYLCLGHPAAESPQPELEAVGWEQRRDVEELVHRR